MATINPNFSIYGIIERSRQASILIRHSAEMQKISYRMERRICEEELDGLFFVGFQTVSRFLKQRKQYQQIAKQVEHVYVFAVFDVPPPKIDGIKFVALKATDELAKEWFLIFHGTDYFSALVGREDVRETADGEKSFKSIWTFDLDIIKILSDWLVSLLDIAVVPYLNYDYSEQGRLMDDDLDDFLRDTTPTEPPRPRA